MKIAVISDIHGNYQALKRCLEDSISQDVDAYIWLGDYLGEFPYPQDTMKTLYNMQTRYPCYFLRGNKEDYWINRRKDTFCDWKDGNHSIMAMIYTYENLKATAPVMAEAIKSDYMLVNPIQRAFLKSLPPQ